MRDAATPNVPTSSSCLDSTSPTEHLCRAPTNMKALQQQGRALFGPLLSWQAGLQRARLGTNNQCQLQHAGLSLWDRRHVRQPWQRQ